MDHPQTPRVLQPHLSNFQHRIVRVLGKVVQLRGENAIIDAGGQIDIVLNRVRPSCDNANTGPISHQGTLNPSQSYPHQLLGVRGVRSATVLTKYQDAHLAVGHAVEVIGKVDGNLAIRVQAATDFGTNIGM